MDDQVFRDAKIEAIKAGKTFSAFVEEALREEALRRRAPQKPFTFTVSNGGALRPGIDLETIDSMMDEEEWLESGLANSRR